MRRVALISLIALCCSSNARAGNLDAYFQGNSAAMTGGAVLSVGADASALWYNPAGLSGVRRNAVDLTSNAFVLRARDLPRLVTAEIGGQSYERGLGSVEFLSVPTSLVYVRQINPKLIFAGGLFVPVQDEYKMDDVLQLSGALPRGGQSLDYAQRLGLTKDVVEYFGAVGLGFKMSPKVRLGVAFYASYFRGSRTAQFWTSLTGPGSNGTTDTAGVVDLFEEERRITMQLGFGLQWEFAKHWHLGFAVRTPQLLLVRWGRSDAVLAASSVSPGGPGSSRSEFEPSDLSHGFALLAPMKVSLGLTRTFDWGTVALEGDFHHRLIDVDLGIDRVPVGNVRAGVRVRVADDVDVGAGIFTDLSERPAPRELADDRVNFFGASLGVQFRTRYELADMPEEEALVFSTTVGVRYALGLGQVSAMRYDVAAGTLAATRSDVIYHDFGIHLGSSVSF